MDVAARQQILHRGLDDIFEPSLRASIGELIDDVRERGDEAVCDALDRFDGITVSPDALRLSDDEYESATVSQEVASLLTMRLHTCASSMSVNSNTPRHGHSRVNLASPSVRRSHRLPLPGSSRRQVKRRIRA